MKYCTLFLGAGFHTAIKKILNGFYKQFLQKFKYLCKILFIPMISMCLTENFFIVANLILYMNFNIGKTMPFLSFYL